ncbi:MAG: hypothetical protein H0T95_08255 [Chthoniobacterales bacterium]|nr:hypothetical protein [Chthoniobacterales bacterium]
MTRAIEEVAKSQRSMVQRLNTKGAALDDAQLHRGLAAHRDEIRKWMRTAQHVESIEIDYPALINDPQSVIPKVVEFLGGERLPHAGEMLSAIDASLHRQKG